jgi:hypothetical protein
MIDLTGKSVLNPDLRFEKREKTVTLTAIISGMGYIRCHSPGACQAIHE